MLTQTNMKGPPQVQQDVMFTSADPLCRRRSFEKLHGWLTLLLTERTSLQKELQYATGSKVSLSFKPCLMNIYFFLFETFIIQGLTFLAKFDTSYCRNPFCSRVLLAHQYISAITSSAGTVISPRCTCLNSWVPRSRVSWYRDTWSSHVLSSSVSSFSQDSTVCPGRPNMTSTDTLPGHSLWASSMVFRAWWELWSLPRILKSSSCKD